MTKKERAARIQGMFVEAFAPESGEEVLHVTVQALSKDNLLIEALLDGPPGHQLYLKLDMQQPDVVRQIHDHLAAGPPVEEGGDT